MQDPNQLLAHIAYLERQLGRYQAQEDAMVRALSQAQQSAYEIQEEAKRKAAGLLQESDAVIRDAQRITANARGIMEQAELEGQQRMLSARIEADKLLLDTQMYSERMNKETENHVRIRLSELQRLVEDSQRTLESSRTRMAYIIHENMDNIRVFMNKISSLQKDAQSESLKRSLNETLEEMQAFLTAFRTDEVAPRRENTQNAAQMAFPGIRSAETPKSQALYSASEPAADDDDRVWTVDDVMRDVEKAAPPEKPIPRPVGQLLSDDALDQMPILPMPGRGARDGAASRLDAAIDEGLAKLPIKPSAPKLPDTSYSVDARLDDIISRMIRTDTPLHRTATYGVQGAGTPLQTPPQKPVPQAVSALPQKPMPQAVQTPPQMVAAASNDAPTPMPQAVMPTPKVIPLAGPASASSELPSVLGAEGNDILDKDWYVEGLQLRRGGHSNLSPEKKNELASFIRTQPGQFERDENGEALPDDFEL